MQFLNVGFKKKIKYITPFYGESRIYLNIYYIVILDLDLTCRKFAVPVNHHFYAYENNQPIYGVVDCLNFDYDLVLQALPKDATIKL
jgi:hypothetical protein